MTNQEAQFVLNAYRPAGHDAGDAAFRDALQQARQDPALGAWFAREQSHATAMAAKLREIAPPPALRDAILAGARLGAPARAWWAQPAWLAAAAAVAMLLAATAMLWPQRAAAQAARLEAFAVNDTEHSRHGGHGEETRALQLLLEQPSTRLGTGVPVDFASLKKAGCRTISYVGHDVLEVCFVRGGSEFHLYTVRRADFPRMPAGEGAEFGEHEGMSYASWTDAERRYVVVSPAGVEAIKGLL